MKRSIIVFILLLVAVMLCGCSNNGAYSSEKIEEEEMNSCLFMTVSDEANGFVVVDKATRVMYWKAYHDDSLTLLVNPNGTPRIWRNDL